jgi:phosphatidate cytidylyltransferase
VLNIGWAGNLSSLTTRVLTAIVLVVLLVGTLFFLPTVSAIFLLGILLHTGRLEWSGFFLADRLSLRLAYVLMLVVLAASVSLCIRAGVLIDALLLLAAIWWLFVAAWLIFGKAGVPAGGCALAGIMGFIPGWYAVMRLFAGPDGAWLFIWLVVIVAAADIGAYFVGRSLGRNKLAPQISPGKTREGLLGGVICAALATAAGASIAGAPVYVFAGAGALIGLVSVVGDLTVSLCKRSAGLKDSGRILPGHGGVMDRIDSLIAALPLFVLILLVSGMLVGNTVAW